MKKRHIAALSLSLACSLTVGFAMGNLQPQTAAADTQKVFANLFEYDESAVTLTDYSAAAQAKGLDAGKTGLHLKSVKSGTDAEGTTITYGGALSGAFSMDFRVFSEYTYQGAYPFIANNVAGNTAAERDAGTNTGIHFTYAAGGVGAERWTKQENDNFNPYQDLKQVNIVFSSITNPDVKFSVNVYGSQPQSNLASRVSARVAIPGSTWARGYGQTSAAAGSTANNNWNLDTCTSIDSTFTNNMYRPDVNNPVNIQFDPATMTVFSETGGTRQVIRTLTNNDWWASSSAERNAYYGTLPEGSFDDGYTVSIVFADVTANSQTIDYTVGQTFDNGKYSYASLYEEDGTTLKTYDRYANMVIYSMNGVSFDKPTDSVTENTAATTAGGVTLDAAKYENGGKALHLTTSKTGDAAEGTTFTVNNTFTGDFETDFRVYSQKTYTPKDTTKAGTDFVSWSGSAHANIMSDTFNPYLDLREVAFTFTSVTDSSKWVRMYVLGVQNNNGGGHANAVSAHGYSSLDASGAHWGGGYYGYGLSDKGTYGMANGANSNYYLVESTPFQNASFSNYVLTNKNAQNISNSMVVGFDVDALQIWGYDGVNKYVIRDFTNANGVHTGQVSRWPNFFSLDSNPFAAGYTVDITFTQVTADNFTSEGSSYSWADASYAALTEQYARTPNMLVYSMKDGDTALAVNNGLIKQAKTTPAVKATVSGETSVGSTLTVVPTVTDAKAGALTYTGAISWKNLKDNTTGVAENGSFVAATPGTYAITVGAMAESGNFNATPAFTLNVEVTGYNVVLKSDAGAVLATRSVKVGESYTFESLANATENTFLGWKYSGGLYPVGYTMTPDGDVEIVAESIVFAMKDGASIRTEETAGHSYGLRFQANVDKDKLAALGATVVSAKGNILPADMIENGVWSNEALVLNLDLSSGSDTFVITNIYLSNFNRKFAARAYLEIAYADGSVGKVYTAYDEAKNAFAVNYIAKKALEDAAVNTTKYTADEIKVFNGYVNSVIEVTYDAQMNLTSNNATVYTVEKVSFVDGVLTAKATFVDGAYHFHDFEAQLVRLAVTAYDAQGNALRIVRPTFVSYENGVLTATMNVA